jgi:uncharacterized protein YjiS (DUF1127 family)
MTMSATYNSNRSVPFGAISIFRATSSVEHLIQAVTVWNRARTTRRALANLSDAQLADVGITRDQISLISGALARR